jgi:hypothetical protein
MTRSPSYTTLTDATFACASGHWFGFWPPASDPRDHCSCRFSHSGTCLDRRPAFRSRGLRDLPSAGRRGCNGNGRTGSLLSEPDHRGGRQQGPERWRRDAVVPRCVYPIPARVALPTGSRGQRTSRRSLQPGGGPSRGTSPNLGTSAAVSRVCTERRRRQRSRRFRSLRASQQRESGA